VKKSIESIFSRSISIICRFITLTFLVKVLPLSDYGMYQLVCYFMMISVYIYGIEYYMYGNREVAKGNQNTLNINAHVNFFITLLPVTFTLQIIGLFFLLPHDILSFKVVFFVIVINFCEYFNQEIYRYLIMVQRITKANQLLIAKSLIFLALIFAYYFFIDDLDFDSVMLMMFGSYLFLFLISTNYFLKYIIKRKEIKIKILKRKKITKIFKYLLPFIGLMIFSKGLEFFDKFAIEYYYDSEMVGIYSFLFSIAFLTYVFVTSGFYLVYLPQLINMHEHGDESIKKKMIEYGKLVIGSSIILVLGTVMTIEILLNLIDKSELIENINLLYILLAAFFLLNIATIPNIILYVVKRDKDLMIISALTFAFNIVLNFLLLKEYNIYGAAIALLLSYLINLIATSYKANLSWKKLK